ncbi:MAG: caspase family protein [Blastocatellia bacterium]|nr:caspase family protein [Blastocatellia bacterium]
MIEGISAEKTVAVVIGIEQYGLGERWDLDGVAQDALDFAEWLLDRGVKQLQLYLAPLEKNRAICDEFSARHKITWIQATHDNVMHGLGHDMNDKARFAGDLLFLFWSGHGLAGSDRVRHLYFANAVEDHRLAVDFNSVMEMLRDANRSLFKYQIGIVDACANYQGEKDKKLSPASTSVSGEGASAAVNQFVLFGSSVSERAEHDKERRTSVFSSELMWRLKQHQHTKERPWPNFTRLRDELKARFDQLKRDNRMQFTQTPASFRWQWPDEDEGMAGVEINQVSVPRYAQARRIFNEVRTLKACPTEAIDEAYRLTLHPRQNANYATRELADQIGELMQLTHRKTGEALPLFEFALRLEPYSAPLRERVEQELDDAGLPLSQLASLDQRFEQERKHGTGRTGAMRHIVFDLGGDQIEYWHFRGDRFEGTHDWLSDAKVDAAAQISNYLKLLESKGEAGESYFLEFLVKFDAPADLHLPAGMHSYDKWTHGPFKLGRRYPLAVRWRDRTVGKGLAAQALWRAKAEAIKARRALDQSPPLRWLPDRRYKLEWLPDRHDEDCIGFTAASREMWETLLIVLNSGVPFAFWPREQPGRQFKRKFSQEVSDKCRCIDHLPGLLKELRINAGDQANHFCSAVTLLWDDPDRDPLNCGDDQLTPPEE